MRENKRSIENPEVKKNKKNSERVTSVTFNITTYGTEEQRNTTIKRLMESLDVMGHDVKLKYIKTISETTKETKIE